MRTALALLISLTLSFVALAQERTKESGEAEFTVKAGYTLERAEYTRELWVGIPSDGRKLGEVTANDLRKALAKACDDTTSVAVIEPENVEGDASERKTLSVLASSGALKELAAQFSEAAPRIVLVGVNETCEVVLRIARQGIVDGVVLIDPPVEDLPLIEEGARAVGVDVLLHPRSDAELARETEIIVRRLGPWGRSARVLRGQSNFDNLKERLTDAWVQLRAPRAKLTTGLEWITPTELAKQMVGDNDVVFLGELHGNPGAHRAELEFLRYMHSTGRPMALATEQFERDTQQTLDDYLAGKIDEPAFRKLARAWPNYADYRPLIEFCKANKIPVIAGNIPRPLANRVYKEGVEVLEKFSDEEKSWCAPEVQAPAGAYRDKFFKAMGGMGGHDDGLTRMYASQCFKDDTMAESVANWLKANPKGRVLHINGNFHSQGGLGIPEKLALLLPEVCHGHVH